MLVALMFINFRNFEFLLDDRLLNLQSASNILTKCLTKARANNSASCVINCAAGSYKKAHGNVLYTI